MTLVGEWRRREEGREAGWEVPAAGALLAESRAPRQGSAAPCAGGAPGERAPGVHDPPWDAPGAHDCGRWGSCCWCCRCGCHLEQVSVASAFPQPEPSRAVGQVEPGVWVKSQLAALCSRSSVPRVWRNRSRQPRGSERGLYRSMNSCRWSPSESWPPEQLLGPGSTSYLL